MSWQASAWAVTIKAGSPAAKAVLLCLANYADADGYAYPGQQRLAEESEQSVRSVQRHLDALEGKGLITRSRRSRADGSRTSDAYQLHVGTTPRSQGDNLSPDTGVAPNMTQVSGHEQSVEQPVGGGEGVPDLDDEDEPLSAEEAAEEFSYVASCHAACTLVDTLGLTLSRPDRWRVIERFDKIPVDQREDVAIWASEADPPKRIRDPLAFVLARVDEHDPTMAAA